MDAVNIGYGSSGTDSPFDKKKKLVKTKIEILSNFSKLESYLCEDRSKYILDQQWCTCIESNIRKLLRRMGQQQTHPKNSIKELILSIFSGLLLFRVINEHILKIPEKINFINIFWPFTGYK